VLSYESTLVPSSEPEGRTFESCLAHHKNSNYLATPG
jgi:hypothetical protein